MIGGIAPMFTEEVRYWSDDIQRWAAEYNLDPNLLATVMQIESCGHADVSSSAGAQGLFQVMPFHFDAGEDQLDPDTNAKRGASFLNECVAWASGDPNLAMACYNGGPGILSRPYSTWPEETQRYYLWGSTIYADAVQNKESSQALDNWLAAGGSNLCVRAAANLGMMD
jgi:soluble lytic murein transglycosylase-like protein